MSKFLHAYDNDDDNAKAIAIPQVFSENSQAKNIVGQDENAGYQHFSFSNNVS